MNPNQQDNSPQAPERKAPSPAPNPTAEAGAKVKEAQVKLLDAQEALIASSAGSNANPSAANAQPQKQESKREATSSPQEPKDGAAPKPTVAQRAESTVDRVKEEAKVHAPSKPVTEYLSDNVAAMLTYLLGWVSGLLFLFIDRRPFVRFHAAQSVAIFATLNIAILALGGFFLGALLPHSANVLHLLQHVVELVWLVAAVVLMLRAAGGERYRVKVASEYADRAAHSGH